MIKDRNVTFRFKHFAIDDSHCGMKVGTDGVAIGACTECRGANKVIDVGSGSGLIALMIAQRCNAAIDAIETDCGACIDARSNIESSPWNDRINLIEGCFSTYRSDIRRSYRQQSSFFRRRRGSTGSKQSSRPPRRYA